MITPTRISGIQELALVESEVRFFAERNATLRSDRFAGAFSPVTIGWFFVGLRAGVKTLRSRSTRCSFVGALAVMDHSDRGIERLLASAKAPVDGMAKRKLPLSVRMYAARIAFRVARKNRRVFRLANPVNHISITVSRYLAGVACMAQLLAVAALQPESWRATFLTGDISFLRMFAAFASARAERPLLFMMNGHGKFADGSLPFESELVFARDSEDEQAFATRPQRFCLLPRRSRQRVVRADEPLDIGIVLQNYADLDRVREFAAEIVGHPEVGSVLIRPHPGDRRPRPPESHGGTVRFAGSGQVLEEFSEAIDFAIVQGSSAIDHLVSLGVPCFGSGRLHSPEIPWGQINTSKNFRASVPELPESIDKAIHSVKARAASEPYSQESGSVGPSGTDAWSMPLADAMGFVRHCT